MGVFFVLEKLVHLTADADFLHVLRVGEVADHFDDVSDGVFVLVDQLEVFALFALEDAG